MKKSIIILDDLEEQIKFFSDICVQTGHNLIAIDTESDLLDLVQEQNPDLILINAQLKDYDSYLISKKIKLLDKGKNVPIILINRDDRYFNVDLTFESDADDYINYPFKIMEVKHRINQQLLIKTLKDNLRDTTAKLHKIIPHYQRLQEIVELANLQVDGDSPEGQLNILPSRSFLEKVLEREWLRASRQRTSLSDVEGTNISLILAQINDFQRYKDNHELEIVNSCLKIVAEDLRNSARRPGDLVAYFNEDTFAILLPSTDQLGAKKVAQTIGQQVSELQIPHHFSEVSEYISLSFGLATGIPTQAIPATNLIEVAWESLKGAIASEQENVIFADQF
jgi:diguanylate cyclase (GGDEF)-like protein